MGTSHKQVEKILYDRRSAAEALSLSVRSIDYYISQRELMTRRVGKKVMIPASELRRFAAADHFGPIRKTKPSPDSADKSAD